MNRIGSNSTPKPGFTGVPYRIIGKAKQCESKAISLVGELKNQGIISDIIKIDRLSSYQYQRKNRTESKREILILTEADIPLAAFFKGAKNKFGVLKDGLFDKVKMKRILKELRSKAEETIDLTTK